MLAGSAYTKILKGAYLNPQQDRIGVQVLRPSMVLGLKCQKQFSNF